MAERAIADASPLILLARSGLFELLRVVAPMTIVPSAVAGEIRRRGPTDPTVRAIETASWLEVVEAGPVSPEIQAWSLGAGESAVLTLAHGRPNVEAILDDLPARRCATTLGIAVRGTLGLVLLAKQRGEIPAARPVMERLLRFGLYLSKPVLDSALERVGE